jgi:TatD DNase family protein
LYVGLNGCSLKTEENLEIIKHVPLDRMLLETDSPYCNVGSTHAGFKYVDTKFRSVKKEKYKGEEGEMILVKGRNEPCMIV